MSDPIHFEALVPTDAPQPEELVEKAPEGFQMFRTAKQVGRTDDYDSRFALRDDAFMELIFMIKAAQDHSDYEYGDPESIYYTDGDRYIGMTWDQAQAVFDAILEDLRRDEDE